MGFFFFSSRRRHTRYWRDWSSDVCSSDLSDSVARRGDELMYGTGWHKKKASRKLAFRSLSIAGGRIRPSDLQVMSVIGSSHAQDDDVAGSYSDPGGFKSTVYGV